MTSYHDTEAEFPELRDLPTFSAAWYARWRDLHLAKYPEVDQGTRDNLDMFVRDAQEREATCAAPGCNEPTVYLGLCREHAEEEVGPQWPSGPPW